MKKTEESNEAPMPFNHITLNSGNSYVVPIGKVHPKTIDALRDLVKSGGGPVPSAEDRYHFCITAGDGDSCAFSIWTGAVPVVLCVYQGASPRAAQRWEDALDPLKTIEARFGCAETKIEKPAEPWLSALLLPTAGLASADLGWIADFEQCVVETWRRLPRTERSPIRSFHIDAIKAGCSDSNACGVPHDEPPRTNERPPDVVEIECELERIRRQNGHLANRVRRLKEIERLHSETRKTMAELRSQLASFAKDKSELQARIASLSAGAIQQKAESLKAVIEERDFRILELEEAASERDKRAKELEGQIDDLGRRIKWLENRLRTSGIAVA